MTKKINVKSNNLCAAYNSIDEAKPYFNKLPTTFPSNPEENKKYYKTLEKTLHTLWENVDSLNSKNIEFCFSGLGEIEIQFISFLLEKNITSFPNVAQRSGAKFFIIDGELKKTWTSGSKNVDGWLKLNDIWIPYDVKKHTISCLGFTFSELREYLTVHNNVLFIVYDKTNIKINPDVVLSLSHLHDNHVFSGPIEDFRKIEGYAEKIKIITGNGIIVPIDSEYSLFKSQTYKCKDQEKEIYVCPQFDKNLHRTEPKKVTGFANVITQLIS
jgi:hypothetical protein